MQQLQVIQLLEGIFEGDWISLRMPIGRNAKDVLKLLSQNHRFCTEESNWNLSSTLEQSFPVPVGMVMSITTDKSLLKCIWGRCLTDPWCMKLLSVSTSMKGIEQYEGLWYIGSHLVILQVLDIREGLF